ncbi:MAG: hypothetical protein ACRC2T_12380 [Thermoguttaceae bacterium]
MPEITPVAATTAITPTKVLVAMGIRCVLHVFKGPAASDLDNTTNLLYGYKIDDFSRGESSVAQTAVPSEGIMEELASGLVSGGEVGLKFSFDPDAGDPPIVRPDQGIVYTPQAVLWYGFLTTDKKGLVAYGEFPVNISGFGEISLAKGQPGASSMKFRTTGEGALVGRNKVNKTIIYNPQNQSTP